MDEPRYKFRGQESDDELPALLRRIARHLDNHNKVGANTLNQRERHLEQANQQMRDVHRRLYDLEKITGEQVKKTNQLEAKIDLLIDAGKDFLHNIWVILDFLSSDIKTLLERTEPPQTDPDVLVIPRDESHFTQDVDEG